MSKNVVSLDHARKEKALEQKEEKIAHMAQRFESFFPTKATPVKDYLKAKKRKKQKKKP